MTWSASFAPLRRPAFAWYYASQFVNLLGSTMASIALAFAVLDLTNSTAALGEVFAARTIPMVLFLLWGGVLADRFPRTAVIQVTNVASGLVQGAIALLFITGTAQLWEIVVLSVVNGSVSALNVPAMRSVLPSLVQGDQLQPANALMSVSRNGLQVLGPAVGGLLVVTVGSGWALALDAATWLAAAALLLPVKIPPRERQEAKPSRLTELREGWTFFRATTWLFVLVLAFAVLNAVGSGAWMVVGPSVARDTIGRQGWGLVLSAQALGLLVTAIVLLKKRLRRPLFSGVLGISLLGLPMLVLGRDPHLVPLLAITFVAGMGTEVFGIGWQIAIQENVPEAMLSRAYSYDALGSFVAIPIGQLVAGPLAAAVGQSDLLVGAGLLTIGISLLTLLEPSVRSLGRRTPEHAAAQV
jgi:MFS family permease